MWLNLEVFKEAVKTRSALAFRAGGGNFLGIRLQVGATVQTKQMWRVVGVPDQWSAEDLCGVLAKANWSDVEVVAPPLRHKQPWLVRSVPPESVSWAFGAVKVGGQVVMLQRAIQKKPHEASVSRLSNAPARRARGELVPDVESREVAGSVSAGVAPTQCDADPAEDEQMLEVGEGGTSRKRRDGSCRCYAPVRLI